MAEEYLDAGDAAAGVEELGGAAALRQPGQPLGERLAVLRLELPLLDQGYEQPRHILAAMPGTTAVVRMELAELGVDLLRDRSCYLGWRGEIPASP